MRGWAGPQSTNSCRARWRVDRTSGCNGSKAPPRPTPAAGTKSFFFLPTAPPPPPPPRPYLPPDAACNRADYAVPDARVRPLGADDCYRRRPPSMALQVMEVDAIASPAEKPRLKMFQTDTLSINWVEYQGPRDRRQL